MVVPRERLDLLQRPLPRRRTRVLLEDLVARRKVAGDGRLLLGLGVLAERPLRGADADPGLLGDDLGDLRGALLGRLRQWGFR